MPHLNGLGRLDFTSESSSPQTREVLHHDAFIYEVAWRRYNLLSKFIKGLGEVECPEETGDVDKQSCVGVVQAGTNPESWL